MVQWTNWVKRMILTNRYRIKDATTAKRLRAHARAANYVWNYCGEIQEAARRQEKRWPSAFDLIKLTTGSSALLGLHSDTVQAVSVACGRSTRRGSVSNSSLIEMQHGAARTGGGRKASAGFHSQLRAPSNSTATR